MLGIQMRGNFDGSCTSLAPHTKRVARRIASGVRRMRDALCRAEAPDLQGFRREPRPIVTTKAIGAPEDLYEGQLVRVV